MYTCSHPLETFMLAERVWHAVFMTGGSDRCVKMSFEHCSALLVEC